ncbi:MAG: hypothetical protein U0893_08420 [Chloroflexota bacterium]
MSGLRRQLIGVILVAAVAECVLLRIALRLGPVLPARVDVLPIFAIVEKLGVVALNVGVLAAAALLAIAAWDALERGRAGLPLALALLGAILVNLALSSVVVAFPGGSIGLLHGAVTGAAILLTLLSSSQTPGVRPALAGIGLAHGFALAQSAGGGNVWLGGDAGAGWQPSVAAEIAAVMSALILPWACRIRPRTREVVLATAAGLGLTVAGTLQPWGLATVAIWTMAFSLFLPPVVYGAALTSILLTLLALRRQPGGSELAIGLTVIWLAGLKLDVSTFALMALAGLTIASAPTRPLGAAVGVGASRSHRRPPRALTRLVQW